jgi:hypothetical protein
LRLTVNSDGSLSGLLGGYLDWRELYGKDTFDTSSSAGTRETYYHENQIAKYYALKRNADGLPDPISRQSNGISAAYRFTAKNAYVVDPAKPASINEPVTSRIAGIYRALFLKAEQTKAIIPDPPRKAGQSEDDAEPNQEVVPAQKNVKTVTSIEQQHSQSNSLADN